MTQLVDAGAAPAVAPEDRTAGEIRAWLLRHRGIVAVELVWLLFAANFSVGYLWGGDAQTPYGFLQHLFGSSTHAIGYQFGLALFEAPFYAFGRLLEAAGLDTIGSHATREAAIAAGAILYVAAAIGLAYALMRRLGFRYAAVAAGVAVFGTPLFYYGTFSPGQTHAVDTFLTCLALLLLHVAWSRGWPLRMTAALGVVLGVAPTVRYYSAAVGVAIVAALVASRRLRPAAIVSVAAVVVLGALLLLPVATGVDLFVGAGDPGRATGFWPSAPVKMLFSAHRGLFVWSPLAALAVVGFAFAYRALRVERWILATFAAVAVVLVASYSTFATWDAGWSFSERYLTALYPIVAIGFAGLLAVRLRLATALAAVAVAWSLFLAFTMQTVGFDEHHDSAFSLASRAGTQSPGSYLFGVWHISHIKAIAPFNPFSSRR